MLPIVGLVMVLLVATPSLATDDHWHVGASVASFYWDSGTLSIEGPCLVTHWAQACSGTYHATDNVLCTGGDSVDEPADEWVNIYSSFVYMQPGLNLHGTLYRLLRQDPDEPDDPYILVEKGDGNGIDVTALHVWGRGDDNGSGVVRFYFIHVDDEDPEVEEYEELDPDNWHWLNGTFVGGGEPCDWRDYSWSQLTSGDGSGWRNTTYGQPSGDANYIYIADCIPNGDVENDITSVWGRYDTSGW